MPFPTTRLTSAYVGATRSQGPHIATCTNPQVRGVLWRGEFKHWKIRTRHVQRVQCRDVQGFPQETIAAPFSRQAHGGCARQCPVPPRHHAGANVTQVPSRPDISVLATVQSATRANRTGLETRSTHCHTQSILCHAIRSTPGGRSLFRSLAKSQSRAAQTLRHYLRRHV